MPVTVKHRNGPAEISLMLGALAVMLGIVATIVRRMSIVDNIGVRESWGLFEWETPDATNRIECGSDYGGDKASPCQACQAFALIAILMGAFGLASSVKVHPIVESITKLQSTILIAGAGLSALLTFAIYRASIHDATGGKLGESFGLWIVVWLLFWISAAVFHFSPPATEQRVSAAAEAQETSI